MGDSFFKVIIKDENWDVRKEARRLGVLFQLYVDRSKPTEVYVKYQTTQEAQKAKISLANNENVVRVEAMEKWDIPASKKKSENKDMNGLTAAFSDRNAQHKGPANTSGSSLMSGGLIEPIPLMLGMFNSCTTCRKSGASYQCFVCGAFYCGESCQRSDWPGHIIQCLPRLVRIHNGFVPNETQSMAFPPPQMFPMQGINNNNNSTQRKDERKQNVLNKSTDSQHSVKSVSKPIERQQHREEVSAKVTQPSSVPTNVLKNLAMKRHQGQEASTSKPIIGTAKEELQKPATSAADNDLTTTKDNASKLAKRVQQKSAPKRIIEYSKFPLEGEHVKISYVADKAVFVYRSGPEANGQPNRYIDLIKRSVECARGVKQVLSSAPKSFDIVFAPFDGDHYRAVVKTVDGPMATVFYPDFGNSQTVEWSQLKEIPDNEIKYGMCYTHPMHIEGVSEFSPAVKQYLEELLEMEEFELVKVNEENSVPTVEMRHVQELYMLSEKIKNLAKKDSDLPAATAVAAAVEKAITEKLHDVAPSSSYVPVTAEDFIEHDLPTGEDVQLMVVEASELNVSNQVSVILKSDSLAFANMMNECDQHGNKDPHPYQPANENEVFLVHFDGVWCRALMAGLGEDVQYYLLDLGIIRALDEKPKCRRYPAGLTRKIYVCECIVDNKEALGELAKEENNDMLRGKTLVGKVYQHTDNEGDTMHVKIQSIN